MTPEHRVEYFQTARGSKIESVNRNLIGIVNTRFAFNS